MSDVGTVLAAAQPRLLAYVRRRLRDPDQARDVVQETVVRVIEQEGRQRIEQPVAYAFRVADSVIYGQAQRAHTVHEPVDAELACDLPLPDELLDYRQRFARFERALAALPPLRRAVFVKRHIDGLSRSEIAGDLGLSLEAVKKHLVRAMVDLAGCVDDDGRSARRAGGWGA
ncbi:sigma-70 family RNA polymerase sigma factor [Sphingomonas yunnanensis]|uniref:RNA polymerase sigma factor n=1 Tax=Sphingomonas yunnanensis TaxID=310400 RepID=UPI001CA5FBCB|nr:sigma-70 family RNA polymerase sigma factor [Sphingomonas yunnanensis]MBY9062034.1 sigma-70 family RNA polymerase sigma factor [Sphingomonas yunnanensis]